MNDALADNDKTKAEEILCISKMLPDAICKETGNSTTVDKVVDHLIKEKQNKLEKTITNNQVNTVIRGKHRVSNVESHHSITVCSLRVSFFFII